MVVRSLIKEKSHTSFLDLEDGRADTMLDVLRQYQIPISTIFSFGSDSASVMTGRRSGVAVCLKGHNLEIASLHCGAH